MQYYYIMSSTTQKTSPWGRVWASSEAEALEIAERDDAAVRAQVRLTDAILGGIMAPPLQPFLWIDPLKRTEVSS